MELKETHTMLDDLMCTDLKMKKYLEAESIQVIEAKHSKPKTPKPMQSNAQKCKH